MSDSSGAPTPEIGVVIPTWNEEDNVRQICAAVTAELEQHAASHEIVFIDNGSTDRTRELLREICANDNRVRAIFNTRNFGQMRSPTYCVFQVEGQAVIGMGADFQDSPALIGAFIAQWRAGAEIVLAQRRTERASAFTRTTRKLFYNLLARFADYPVVPGVTGFGLYNRRAIDTIGAWHEPEPFWRGMLIESGYRLAVIPFDRPERGGGEDQE